jgi:hypothetical protein
MLGVFLLASQLAPLAHMATHRAGHTHGPQLATFDESGHDAAHRAGQPHAHAPAGRAARSSSHADRFVRHASVPWHDEHADTDHGPDEPAPPGVPDPDHGRESISHFGLALNEAPPPPIVPTPNGMIATAPDPRPLAERPPARPQPPTRGPPNLT